MSVPPQVNTDKSGKHRTAAMKEPVQHSGEVYYGMGPPVLESSHSDSASSSGVYNPEKGPQNVPHYQQAAPVKWMHQDAIQGSGWSQDVPVSAWGQNLTFTPNYMGGVNVRGQMAFHKGVHEGVALPMGGENQLPGPAEVYRDTSQAQTQGRGLEWDHSAMQQAQLQAYQHSHKGVELQGQPHVPSHTLPGSMLQPFQTTFRPGKQQFPSGVYPFFPGNKAMPGLAYGEQPKNQQQLLQQMQQQQQQQQMHQRHQQQQQQQQQQLHQQHHLQLQQQQHLQQQHHQIQQHQMQQQQLQQMQQQYHQQQLQERQQQIQMQQQRQQQHVPQQETTQLPMPPKQQQTQSIASYPPSELCAPDNASKKENVQSVDPQQEPKAQTCDAPSVPDPGSEKDATNPAEALDALQTAPRRSRRLSRDGQSPLGPPSTNIWSQPSKEPQPSQNGVAGTQRGGESQVTAGGVIQVTRRRRRASKEINLETLAQKASEMESLPAKMAKEEGPSGKQVTMMPLIIPVSVPVHRGQVDTQGSWTQGRLGERPGGQSDRKPSVIVARRRSLRNSMTESFGQDGESDSGLDEDGKSKFKRRPRPEPLIIPPPKSSTFIAPSIYSSITSYQSNLRSPVRLPDNPLALPPYTPPPILSPVRDGSGLYFSTFLTNIAVSNQILPPAATPKSATRSLLRSTSSEITPPVLPLIADATPVSLEPRINIGQQYQAEIPELQDQVSSQSDQHKADLVWLPVDNSHLKNGDNESMEDLMNMACSSVLRGGGTNQELVLHCLHECGGDFLDTLERLMLQDPVFPKGHHLAGYHYSGSDSWTAEEKRYFNKGISAYRKDFFVVQKLVRTKTMAQCVEFYYTYKKRVKIGRSGILTFGPPDSPVEKHAEAVVDVKSSHQSKLTQGEADEDDKKDVSYEQSYESSQQARVARSLQAHDYAGTVLVIKEPDTVNKEANPQSAHHRPRAEPATKKSRAPVKPPQDPDAVFPCKKCGRVFYKVKSRSAHMKSHAEQEKKAAALRQKEEEEQAAAEARARKAAAAAAASASAAARQGGNGNGVTEQAEGSSQEDSSEGEDDDDEDWH